MTKLIASNGPSGHPRRHVSFVLFLAASLALTWPAWRDLVSYSLQDDSYSHILIIPFVAFFLIVMDRREIFRNVQPAIGFGVALITLGLAALWMATRHAYSDDGRLFLSIASLAIVIVWVGGFILFYGRSATRAALFPLLFLLFMVPWPDAILTPTISFLQEGSTDIACLIFRIAGVPFLRQGFVVSLPTVTIQVASECSSIRSSIALLITCVLASRFALRTQWRAWLLCMLVVPLSVLKNGIRIATLTLLSIYVDPTFLKGSLHRDGGFVFFLLALAMLWPLLALLQRSERRAQPVSGDLAKEPTAGPLSA